MYYNYDRITNSYELEVLALSVLFVYSIFMYKSLTFPPDLYTNYRDRGFMKISPTASHFNRGFLI